MKKIIENYYEFEKVASIEHLHRLKTDGRACYHSRINRVIPAAALINWQGAALIKDIQGGVLYIYPKGGEGVKFTTIKESKADYLLDLHCQWCADCDWVKAPDVNCMFGQYWKMFRGGK